MGLSCGDIGKVSKGIFFLTNTIGSYTFGKEEKLSKGLFIQEK